MFGTPIHEQIQYSGGIHLGMFHMLGHSRILEASKDSKEDERCNLWRWWFGPDRFIYTYIYNIYIHFFKNNHASGRSFSGDRMVGYSKLDWIVASDWHPKFCLSDSDLSWKNSCCRSSIQWSKGQPLRTKPLLILVEYLAKTRLNSFPMSPRRRGEGDEGDWWGIMIPRLKESTVAGSPWGMRQLSLEQRGVE